MTNLKINIACRDDELATICPVYNHKTGYKKWLTDERMRPPPLASPPSPPNTQRKKGRKITTLFVYDGEL